MKQLPFSNIRSFVLIATLLILSGGIGYRLGERKVTITRTPTNAIIVNQTPPTNATVDFTLFWDVWQRLFRYYYDASSLDPKKMAEGAIVGMVNSLGDPYTAFLPAQENKEFKEDIGGAFDGIGAQLGLKDGRIIVVAPLKGTPAEKAGIKPSDWILKVNDEETVGWTLPQTIAKIRGKGGTTVSLTILHENSQKPLDLAIVRDTITLPSVESWVKRPAEITEIKSVTGAASFLSDTRSIGYIRLSRFGDRTQDEWEKAVSSLVTQLKDTNAKGLIFDLRNNPGGYLEESISIASEFIKDGVIVTQKNSDGTKDDYRVNRKGRLTDIPMVVLINKGSASAAEIVAGALRDYKRATLVGETSFGKGSVQTPQELSGGASLHVTTGLWLLPKGDWIHKKGITPDVVVSSDDMSEASADAQLAKAIEILLK